jgi:hypothetical protein
LAPSGILPRWRCRRCGATVVTAPGAVATEKDPQMSHGKTPRKTKCARAKSRAKRPAKPRTIPSGSTRGGTKQETVLALLRQPKGATMGQQHSVRRAWCARARLDAHLGEGRGRTRLSCACRTAVQIEAEDRRTTGRLAMASMARAIEGKIDRLRSLRPTSAPPAFKARVPAGAWVQVPRRKRSYSCHPTG